MHHVRPSSFNSARAPLALCALAGLLAAGCSWNSFDDFEKTAPIRVHPQPENYELSDYGKVLVTYSAKIGGQEVSRIVASSGGPSQVTITRAWTGSQISEKSPPIYCSGGKECENARDYGAALIPFAAWSERRGCVFAPSNGTKVDNPELHDWPGGHGYVLCETHKAPQDFTLGTSLTVARGMGASLVYSGFGLPTGHPLGVVLFGAYARDDRSREVRSGGLYALPGVDETGKATFALPVPLVDPVTKKPFSEDPEAGDFGRQVVGQLNRAGELLIAISQPAKNRVIVASYAEDTAGELLEKLRVRACIEAPEAGLSGFGERVVLGDVTDDGEPELFIGTDPVAGATPGKQALFMYQGTGLPRADATGDVCPTWNEDAVAIECQDADGVSCAGSAFGASLAIGDVDADGKGDLIVGAPFTKVGGESEVGALWILPGDATGLDLERAIAMTVPTSAKAHFGWAVAALRTKDRDEPVASAPGVNNFYVMMCTPLEQGFGGSELCL